MKDYYIKTKDLSVGYQGKVLIRDINLDIKKGEIVTLIGPNGAGKSTILKSVTRQLKLIGGEVYLDSDEIRKLSYKSMARKVAVMLTERMKPELMTCHDVVATGRYPYTGRLGVLSREDENKVDEALMAVHAQELGIRNFLEISDGQRQRILLARAICQEPEVMILDEPTSYLDIRHKLELLEILRKMAKEKLVKNITSRDEDFAQWYTDVVREANLCDYSSVKGCMNYLPNGYAIWELIQSDLDRRFKETGVENVYLPVLIPESLLEKEADHVEGFAPEVAWVTHGGMERLQERLCVRPTSETLFCDLWAKTVKSYRDLPKVWNQWNSVLRWEKTTRPFLRSREFLWQEGHTLHATYEEAEERTIQMWEVYKDCYKETMAIPFVAGRKAEHEKFAGAEDTYTIEALMHDGKALQSATSHFFGNGFPDAFGIKYVDKNNELHSAYETSWGWSTRSIGALIMVHGDDDGLVLPPHVAPVECRIIPIAQHKEGVLDRSYALLDELKKAGYRVKIDDSDKSTGWKFSEQEILGIPTRIEIGPKDIEKNQVVVVRRDNREKIVVSLDEIAVKLREILEQEQQDMYNRAEEFLNSHIDTATTMDEMVEKFKANRGFVKACWCGDPECEGEVKYQTGGAATRCLIEDEEFISDKCIYCGKPAKHMAYWGKSY